ncbi:MAG: M28 family peptidase [bacterium]
MRRKPIWTAIHLVCISYASPVLPQFNEFNTDSAYANLQHLAVAIGPRPMGSHNERAALVWTTEKFKAFGADTAYVMPVLRSKTVNTTSGVAIGIFSGRTDSIIVIGGHIDSDFRENPGANDDASGTAVMIELARLWSQRPRHYTLLFAAFGGEEGGLVGSHWFVEHFENLARVALMLQIDMAGSEEALIPFFDTKTHQAPEWLVRDAYALDRELGYNSLDYPANFFTLNTLMGGAGSDHDPFLIKKIPAIDFTAGINTSPIHTLNDRVEFIDKGSLARSGRIVDGLLRKYASQGIPAARTGNYMLLEAFGGIWFLPAAGMIAIDAIAILLGIVAHLRSRSQRRQIDAAQRVRFSGIKVFLIVIIIAVFIQLGEAAMQGLKGLRFPWYAPLQEYLVLAGLSACAGIWLGLQLTRIWRFSPEPHVYFSRTMLALLGVTLLCLVADARLALYPALTLSAASLTVLLPGAIPKAIVAVLAPLPLVFLMFHEAFPLLSRSLPHNMTNVNGWVPALLYSGFLTLALVIWYFPLVYLFASTYARQPKEFGWMRSLRTRAAGLILLVVILAYGGYLYAQPAYNERWRAFLRVVAEYDANTKTSKLKLAGDEYFRGVTVQTPDSAQSYNDRIHQAEWPLAFAADWMNVSGKSSRDQIDSNRVTIDWLLTTVRPWDQVQVTVGTDTLALTEMTSPWIFSNRKGMAVFNWSAEPADSLRLTAKFKLSERANLVRKITATYAEFPVPVEVEAKYADVIYRTEVIRQDTLVLTDLP